MTTFKKHELSAYQRLQDAIPEKDMALFVTSEMNRLYLTGFKASAGLVIITKDRAFFLVDDRYYEHAAEYVDGIKVIKRKDKNDKYKEQIEYILQRHEIRSVAIERKQLSVGSLEKLRGDYPSCEFDTSPWLSDTIEKMRAVKSQTEIRYIERAQRIAEQAFERLLTQLHAGVSEKKVAALLNYYILDCGGDGVSFDTIVASGQNSAVPHAVPTEKTIETGDFVVFDFGAVYKNYHSDMTRTVSIGTPDDEMRRVHDAVISANRDGIKAVKSGVTGRLVDNAARRTLDAWGYEQQFTHGLGHGVGLDIHEFPTVSDKSDTTLYPNMVVTIEPGVYFPKKFGVRIEDMVVVTENGCLNLTKTPKTLRII